MHYDFDTVIDRSGTYSDKWDYLKRYYGEDGMLGLWVADMDFACPPCVVDAVVKRAGHPIYGYTEIDENNSFYDGMISWYERRHNYHIEKDWIIFASGVIPAINYAIQAFSDEGDKIVIQEPVYHPFKNSILSNRRVPLINELKYDGEKYVMDLEDLERKIDEKTKILILCSPHNPVGRVWTRKELTAIGELALRRNLLVIADEIHGDLVLGENEHICFPSISEEFSNHTILCNAPTKTFNFPGLQGCSIIIPNADIRAKYEAYLERFHLQGPTPIWMAATEAAYLGGEAWLEELLEYLRGNVAFLDEFLKKELPQARLIPPDGTYMCWVDFRGTGLTPDEINDRIIKKAKVAFNDGAMFGESGAGFQRVNVACPRSILREAFERITAAFKETK